MHGPSQWRTALHSLIDWAHSQNDPCDIYIYQLISILDEAKISRCEAIMITLPLQWRHEREGVSNHGRLDCLLNRLSGADERNHQSSASLAFVGGNSPVTGEFPAQRASDAEKVSIWWRYHRCEISIKIQDACENTKWWSFCLGLNMLNVLRTECRTTRVILLFSDK